MGIFSKINNINPSKAVNVSPSTSVDILESPSEEVEKELGQQVVENTSDNSDVTEEPQTPEKIYKIKFAGKKYKVKAANEEEAINKVKDSLGIIENEHKEFTITVKDIINAIAYEINRIVTVAHPETVQNTYDRWVCVLTEELGEIVHEINDAHEGKPAKKNTFVECIQLSAATILLAKKFANEHPELFIGDGNETI